MCTLCNTNTNQWLTSQLYHRTARSSPEKTGHCTSATCAKGSCLPRPESEPWIELFQELKDIRSESEPSHITISASITQNNTLYDLWLQRPESEPQVTDHRPETHPKPHLPTPNHTHPRQTTFDSTNPFILDFVNFKSLRVAKECYSYFCANLYFYFGVNHRLTSFFSSLHKQKNLVNIQGINSLTRLWLYVYYNHCKLAIFTFSHEYKKDHAFPDFLLAPCATITTLLRNVKLDFFTKPVKKTRQDDSKTRLKHSCTR
jgi:hypothetical protein